ncbi:hypothetical protein H9P43_006401 [Blastocladiella emersonii ATCC 22665]|nr:hypothetical protein H9P43_006401 [Blastocladiella emersonii ATCC 22665]
MRKSSPKTLLLGALLLAVALLAASPAAAQSCDAAGAGYDDDYAYAPRRRFRRRELLKCTPSNSLYFNDEPVVRGGPRALQLRPLARPRFPTTVTPLQTGSLILRRNGAVEDPHTRPVQTYGLRTAVGVDLTRNVLEDAPVRVAAVARLARGYVSPAEPSRCKIAAVSVSLTYGGEVVDTVKYTGNRVPWGKAIRLTDRVPAYDLPEGKNRIAVVVRHKYAADSEEDCSDAIQLEVRSISACAPRWARKDLIAAARRRGGRRRAAPAPKQKQPQQPQAPLDPSVGVPTFVTKKSAETQQQQARLFKREFTYQDASVAESLDSSASDYLNDDRLASLDLGKLIGAVTTVAKDLTDGKKGLNLTSLVGLLGETNVTKTIKGIAKLGEQAAGGNGTSLSKLGKLANLTVLADIAAKANLTSLVSLAQIGDLIGAKNLTALKGLSAVTKQALEGNATALTKLVKLNLTAITSVIEKGNVTALTNLATIGKMVANANISANNPDAVKNLANLIGMINTSGLKTNLNNNPVTQATASASVAVGGASATASVGNASSSATSTAAAAATTTTTTGTK